MAADDVRDGESTREEGAVTSSGPVTAAPWADPGPAALGAFGITLGLLSFFNAGLAPAESQLAFIPQALFAGGLLILLAGLIDFRRDSLFTATVFSAYGIFWIALGFHFLFAEQLGLTDPEGVPDPAKLFPAVGFTLLMWTIFTVFVWIASIKTNVTIFITITVLLLVLVVLTLGFLTASAGLIQIGGYLGILDALLAFYLAGALLINPLFGRDVLPLR